MHGHLELPSLFSDNRRHDDGGVGKLANKAIVVAWGCGRHVCHKHHSGQPDLCGHLLLWIRKLGRGTFLDRLCAVSLMVGVLPSRVF